MRPLIKAALLALFTAALSISFAGITGAYASDSVSVDPEAWEALLRKYDPAQQPEILPIPVSDEEAIREGDWFG